MQIMDTVKKSKSVREYYRNDCNIYFFEGIAWVEPKNNELLKAVYTMNMKAEKNKIIGKNYSLFTATTRSHRGITLIALIITII